MAGVPVAYRAADPAGILVQQQRRGGFARPPESHCDNRKQAIQLRRGEETRSKERAGGKPKTSLENQKSDEKARWQGSKHLVGQGGSARAAWLQSWRRTNPSKARNETDNKRKLLKVLRKERRHTKKNRGNSEESKRRIAEAKKKTVAKGLRSGKKRAREVSESMRVAMVTLARCKARNPRRSLRRRIRTASRGGRQQSGGRGAYSPSSCLHEKFVSRR